MVTLILAINLVLWNYKRSAQADFGGKEISSLGGGRNSVKTPLDAETRKSSRATKGTEDDDYAHRGSQPTRDWCYKRNGIMNNDLASCERIQDRDTKDDCYHQVGRGLGDLSVCEKIRDEDFRDYCYSGVARKKSDPSVCDELDTPEGKDICYENVGVGMKDLAICHRILDQRIREHCYSEVNRLKG